MLNRLHLAAFALAAVVAASLPAAAQIDPTDAATGTKLGVQQLNNSGQIGTVTLFTRGNKTLVVVHVEGEPAGRVEPAHIHRGKDCDSIDPKPMFGLNPIKNGNSSTLVNAPETRLLSGNYSVNIHASDSKLTHYVACGHLYK